MSNPKIEEKWKERLKKEWGFAGSFVPKAFQQMEDFISSLLSIEKKQQREDLLREVGENEVLDHSRLPSAYMMAETDGENKERARVRSIINKVME